MPEGVNVKQAVQAAREHISDLFGDEQPYNIGLEEVFYNEADDAWEVTIGFSRPWKEQPAGVANSAANIFQPPQTGRDYKVVRVDGRTGEVRSVKMRSVNE